MHLALDSGARGVGYSEKFLRAFRFSILGWEAVYAKGHYGDPLFVVAENVKGDPGGVTKFGIDQRDHPSVGVRHLTFAQAQEIFHTGTRDRLGRLEGGEWARIRGDDLQERWAIALFDCVVNPGRVAIAWTQEILGLRADGKVGPITTAAVNAASDKQLRMLLYKRDVYYETRGAWATKFKPGWRARNRALRHELGLA